MEARPMLRKVRTVKRLFQDFQHTNQAAIKRTGDIDIPAVRDDLEDALADPIRRAAVMFGIAEFICKALDGTVIKPDNWKPLRPPRP